jgi:hypothetical protein
VLTVEQAGIDTWSPAWYVRDGDRPSRALNALCSVKIPRGYAMPDKVAGHKIGWFPSHGLVFAEGHPGGDRLGTGDELPAVLWQLESALWDLGVQLEPARTHSRWAGVRKAQAADRLPGFAGVRRIDVTADLRFERGADGLAALAGVAAMQLPRMKCATWRSTRGQLETVALYGFSGRKMLARWYDKGIESGSARRGELIRPEDQRRFTAATRREVEELSSAHVRDRFRQRFLPLWQATKGVKVAGTSVLAEKLADLVADGVLTDAQAERLAGYCLMHANGHSVGSRATGYRRRAALRDHGIVHAQDDALQQVEVDLHAVLEAALEADCWDRAS